MVTVDASATAVDGVTLVTVHLSDADVDRRVRVEHRLDGPVWPPRREGQPEAGWGERGYEGIVPADGGLAIGYATPAPPQSDPVAVHEGDPVRAEADDCPADPATVVRELGDPAPPRAAVPIPDAVDRPSPNTPATASDEPAEQSVSSDQPGDLDDTGYPRDAGDVDDGPPERDTAGNESAVSTEAEADGTSQAAETTQIAVPDGIVETAETERLQSSDQEYPVTEWFAAVERRLATVERLEAAESVPEATTALRDAGGLEGARRVERALAADHRRLAAIATRANRLADRAEAADAPLATLEKLA